MESKIYAIMGFPYVFFVNYYK